MRSIGSSGESLPYAPPLPRALWLSVRRLHGRGLGTRALVCESLFPVVACQLDEEVAARADTHGRIRKANEMVQADLDAQLKR
jgi:hypothetical protein